MEPDGATDGREQKLTFRKLVLFDIDGTILFTHGAGRRAIRKAIIAELGTTGDFDRVRFDGKTDPQIVRELMEAAGHPESDDRRHHEAVCERYVEVLERELDGDGVRVQVLEGVRPLLRALQETSEVLLGLLTGNLSRGAHLKLTAGGIDPAIFRVGAFGSDAPERDALPAIAAQRAEDIMGGVPSGEDVVIIGDTPADMRCGRTLGARAIGVSTGSYSCTELEDAGAYATFPDLSNTSQVIQSILA